jgi:hypothetical protein
MEIEGLSKSWISEVQQYTVTRLLAPHILALWALLAVATWYASQSTAVAASPADMNIGGGLLWNVCMLGCLLFQFRLWDDLADVQQDLVEYPDRVLVRSEQRHKFWLLMAAFAAGNLVIVGCWRPWPAVASLVVLMTLSMCWYRFSLRRQWSVANYHLVLFKYPVFVFSIGCATGLSNTQPLLTAMLVVYLALCIYEVVVDSRLRTLKTPRVVARLETVMLIATLVVNSPLVDAKTKSADSADRSPESESTTVETQQLETQQ